MSDWSAGYVADIGYTFGLYPELNPLRLKLAFLHAGLAFPEVGAACELGFGQGVSINVHAAASVTEWHGTDFNPSQAAFAQDMAVASDAHAQLHDESFAQFCSRSNLPDFDFIAMHGIWSWISEENRAILVEFVQRKLKPGGVLYVSYNTQPGWAAMAPMRDLLAEHCQVMGVPGKGVLNRIDQSLDFAQRLFATEPRFLAQNPAVAQRVSTLKSLDRSYVAHEYFNRDWTPMSFSATAQQLQQAKLTFACSAHYLEHIDPLNLTAEQQALLAELPDPSFRETVRDFMMNQQFRRDYWVRGPRRLSNAARDALLRQQKIVLAVPRKDVVLKTAGLLGEAALDQKVYGPVLELLADHQPRTLGEIEAALSERGLTLQQLLELVMILSNNGTLLAVQDDHAIAGARPQTDRLNRYLCEMAVTGTEVLYLASPVTGGGCRMDRFTQMFLLAYAQGDTGAAQLGAFVEGVLKSQNQLLQKQGEVLSAAEQGAELRRLAELFVADTLPVMRALGIAA
ncbi:methyltransferase [Massilia sp. Root351]|uniref:class I SAM-dependent methyltransferase n=1 Tax=Massilia sp. Root351 TaxID=1736522 RepID=UPI000708E803|nr:class I SAM-dependent methyltransferase [Massilia sp. Root351]KQV89871.1 methyltransferase [Massilia sp. Root351]